MVIIGARGFAKEVLETFHQKNELDDLYFFDNVSLEIPDKLYGQFQIIKDFAQLAEVFKRDNRFVLGLGNPLIRHKLSQEVKKHGGELVSSTSPLADIGHYNVYIDKGCNIMSGVRISNSIDIGEGVLININCTIGHDTKIGKYSEVSPAANISGECYIGDFCNIGTGAILLPKVKLGDNVTIGAGTIVSKDIPSDTTFAVAQKKMLWPNQNKYQPSI